ncbi:MAG TPA: hypothetical protein VE844_07950 [Gammaproteobacteria bacterium]|nr:hypothetical protein [Gammaproteobacteria bacterium]
MRVAVFVLTVVFWLSFVVLVGWVTLYAWNDALIVDQLGEKGARFLNTVLFGVVALSSGLLVAYYRLTNIFIDPERYWTGAEVFYALVLFASLFFGLYSFLGWYFYG